MKSVAERSISDLIREHVCEMYLKNALRDNERTFTVNVGAVHKALALNNRVPQVCSALESRKLLQENGLRIVSKTGPPSGQSTTVTFTYEIMDCTSKPASLVNPLLGLRGVAKQLFEQLGGGENFIQAERAKFAGEDAKQSQ